MTMNFGGRNADADRKDARAVDPSNTLPPEDAVVLNGSEDFVDLGDAHTETERRLELRPQIVDNCMYVLEPQGAFGALEDIGSILGKGDRTDLGGQIVFEMCLALASARYPLAAGVDTPNDIVVASQGVRPGGSLKHAEIFPASFVDGQQEVSMSNADKQAEVPPVRVLRIPLGTKAEAEQYANVDKLDLSSNDENIFYANLEDWSRNVAQAAIAEGKVPRFVRAGLGIGAYCAQFFLDELKKSGVDTDAIVVVGQVHSSGESSLTRGINEALEAIDVGSGPDAELDGHQVYEVVRDWVFNVDNGRGIRMLAERAWARGITIASTEKERDGLLRWHSRDVPGLPKLDPESVKVLEPGVHPAFYRRSARPEADRNTRIEALHDSIAEKLDAIEAKFSDPSKPLLVLRGRWIATEDRKGFASLVYALGHKQDDPNYLNIRDQVNVLILASDANGDPLTDFQSYPDEIKGVPTVMKSIRNNFKSAQLDGSLQFAGITDQMEQATLTQVMGERNESLGKIKYLGGSFAEEEPLGLIIGENASTGVVNISTAETGGAEVYSNSNAIETYGHGMHAELSEAIRKTLERGTALVEGQVEIASQQSWESRAKNFTEVTVAARDALKPDVGNSSILVDFNNRAETQKLLYHVMEYMLDEVYHNKIFTPGHTRSILGLNSNAVVDDNKITLAKTKLLNDLAQEYKVHEGKTSLDPENVLSSDNAAKA